MGVFIVDDEKIAEALEDKVRIDILILLKRKGELHINKISQLLHKHRSTITRHLTKLIEAELIEKIPTQSGYVYRLTNKGDKVLEDLQESGFTIRVKSQKQGKRELFYYTIIAVLAGLLLYIAITPISIHTLTRIIIIVPLAYILYTLIKKSKETPALKQD
ncbi:MAG: helix-turn-helix transcriptional regulator [Thermoproteales archaeon]|nr:helix-turn-helix transcriptional regulator [Thermoproteales archaeon]